MPKITVSGIWKVPGLAGPILEGAGIHPSHGLAIQSVASDLERIIISRCATPAGIQLLDEGYASKRYGIKAKSCDWGQRRCSSRTVATGHSCAERLTHRPGERPSTRTVAAAQGTTICGAFS